jgi:hypothetical protein
MKLQQQDLKKQRLLLHMSQMIQFLTDHNRSYPYDLR